MYRSFIKSGEYYNETVVNNCEVCTIAKQSNIDLE